jgi:Holliday junction resolvase RusA-like endonuclease
LKKTIQFILPITPKSCQHGARARVIRGKFCGYYNDAEKTSFIDSIINESLGFKPAEPLAGPLDVEYKFYFPRPERDESEHPDKVTSDWDNVCKGVQDALSKAGFWSNDKQVVHGQGWKLWAEEPGMERMEIIIKQL